MPEWHWVAPWQMWALIRAAYPRDTYKRLMLLYNAGARGKELR